MPCARGARRIMKLFRYIEKLSHEELKTAAMLCAGAALLAAFALVLSGALPVLPQSLKVALQSAASSQSAAVATYTTPSTYSWTAPGGVTSVTVTIIGGGGGGTNGTWSQGGCSGDAGVGGAGGAGGYIVNQVVAVTPGQSYTVTVGAGGAGGAYGCPAYNNGSAGGNSSFGTVTATGGGAGVWYTGGTGGTPQTLTCSGGFGSSGKSCPYNGTGGGWGYCGPTTAGYNSSGYGSGGLSQCNWGGQAGLAGYVSVSYADPCPTSIETPWQSIGLLLSPGTTRKVTQLGNNFCLTNNSGNAYFIPANTSNELQSFINAIGSLNVTKF